MKFLPIGERGIREVCRQQKRWQDQGHNLILSVNLSLRQFFQDNLVGKIAEIIDETQIDPRHLELEITESTIMEGVEKTLTILTNLKKLGVRISIDDFGTGFSSLNHLMRYPVDALKIDRSFIQNILIDNKATSIVLTMIKLAKSLGLSVVAEGVENELQQLFLKEHGCEQIQGYLFSPPIPIDKWDALYERKVLMFK
jgi:EAL domain-containing protein (putative c-di-GMP-specific phosphodiesterase class I)